MEPSRAPGPASKNGPSRITDSANPASPGCLRPYPNLDGHDSVSVSVERVLVSAEMTGGADALERLYHQHVGGLVRALTVVVGDRETAADCVQEAFLRAHQRWDHLEGYEDPIGWVRHVAINLARDVQRRRRRGRVAQRRLLTDAGRHGDRQATAEPVDRLGVELAVLPARQRAALALRYVEGLSVREIASALGISEGAVKFHLHAGRERLRPIVRREEQA